MEVLTATSTDTKGLSPCHTTVPAHIAGLQQGGMWRVAVSCWELASPVCPATCVVLGFLVLRAACVALGYVPMPV